MKKKIAMVFLVLTLGCSVTYAQGYEYHGYVPHLIAGPIGIVGGGIILFMDSSDTGQMWGWILLGAGVLDLSIGLILKAVDEPAFVQNNPILKHTSLSITPEKTFIGASFSF
jgi:hypothetical protein